MANIREDREHFTESGLNLASIGPTLPRFGPIGPHVAVGRDNSGTLGTIEADFGPLCGWSRPSSRRCSPERWPSHSLLLVGGSGRGDPMGAHACACATSLLHLMPRWSWRLKLRHGKSNLHRPIMVDALPDRGVGTKRSAKMCDATRSKRRKRKAKDGHKSKPNLRHPRRCHGPVPSDFVVSRPVQYWTPKRRRAHPFLDGCATARTSTNDRRRVWGLFSLVNARLYPKGTAPWSLTTPWGCGDSTGLRRPHGVWRLHP